MAYGGPATSWHKDPDVGKRALEILDQQKRKDDYTKELHYHYELGITKYRHALTTLVLAVRSELSSEKGDVSWHSYKSKSVHVPSIFHHVLSFFQLSKLTLNDIIRDVESDMFHKFEDDESWVSLVQQLRACGYLDTSLGSLDPTSDPEELVS